MEEDMKILEDFKNNNFEKDKLERNEKGGFKIGTIYKTTELNPAIENLINKYKELRQKMLENRNLYSEQIEKAEKEIHRLRDEIDDLEFENKEQEKMIELMAKAFKQDDIRNEDEIIEYFRKEAKKNEKSRKN